MSKYDKNEPAYIYCATIGGKGWLLYETTIGDAIKVCEHPETKGRGRGGEWALMWTSKENYFKNGGVIPKKGRKDDGRFDVLFENLGVNVSPIFK